ncbi:hypothetical protein Pmar_PMAR024403 [Perkinsus marinus ATCC 50983]|uniref:DUF5703 domain-containing protein n=1 Tax=Perkinsus marinus (strain ATCC 50983 / TXsc) TaxID=423536 RepID=C5KM01_PERM5|nr:hypothetical protein Pmar_PMAR024403 [Perkinsus marinus ATCC 50983]EER14516.1 hypothetical protein Pmar_PMAR024403 [Perkinsus marinus ATCC 50983]|eukprot:XP_002782721.1 hypothetical protein Pmar_PMAR024403 [Perkinsus marinus ATCC 50983]
MIAFIVAVLLYPVLSVTPPTVTWIGLLPEENATTYVNAMPIGNGALAANVIVDNKNASNPIIALLISDQRSWNEAGEFIKVGKVTLELTPNPWGTADTTSIKQVLNTSTGSVILEVGPSPPTRVEAYVDALKDVLVVNISSPTPIDVSVVAELLRPKPFSRQPLYHCRPYNVSADFYLNDSGGVIGWAHANVRSDYTTSILEALNLESLKGSITDRIANRSTAATWRFGTPMIATLSVGKLKTSEPSRDFSMVIGVATSEQGLDPAVAESKRLIAEYNSMTALEKHMQWWAQFWNRSWIEITGPRAGEVNSKSALHRYLQGIQSREPIPIKFNGMLFTAQREEVDYNKWGGLNWWQNARMPYYNMFASGDADMVDATFLQAFLSTLKYAEMKTKVYYPNMSGDAAYWDEYNHPLIGSTHPMSYGCGREGRAWGMPVWYSVDPPNHYNLQGGLDLSLLALDHYSWTRDATVLTRNLPMVDAVVNFFAQWRTGRNDNGKMMIFPGQALETWVCLGYQYMQPGLNCTLNDMPTVAGLHAVLARLEALPTELTTAEQRQRWAALKAVVPPLPLTDAEVGGGKKLAPCEACGLGPENFENAELYAVHPYRLVTAKDVGENLEVARAAYREKRFTTDDGWNQNVMDAALLGLAIDAQELLIERAAKPAPEGYRFTAFGRQMQDWHPSLDHYSVMRNGLIYALLQPLDDADDGMLLFPAWPCEWDVDLKLWGPRQTLVQAKMVNGVVTEFHVEPQSRNDSFFDRFSRVCFTAISDVVIHSFLGALAESATASIKGEDPTSSADQAMALMESLNNATVKPQWASVLFPVLVDLLQGLRKEMDGPKRVLLLRSHPVWGGLIDFVFNTAVMSGTPNELLSATVAHGRVTKKGTVNTTRAALDAGLVVEQCWPLGADGVTSAATASNPFAASAVPSEATKRASLLREVVKTVLLVRADGRAIEKPLFKSLLLFTRSCLRVGNGLNRECLEMYHKLTLSAEGKNQMQLKMGMRRLMEKLGKRVGWADLAAATPEEHRPLVKHVQKQLERERRRCIMERSEADKQRERPEGGSTTSDESSDEDEEDERHRVAKGTKSGKERREGI